MSNANKLMRRTRVTSNCAATHCMRVLRARSRVCGAVLMSPLGRARQRCRGLKSRVCGQAQKQSIGASLYRYIKNARLVQDACMLESCQSFQRKTLIMTSLVFQCPHASSSHRMLLPTRVPIDASSIDKHAWVDLFRLHYIPTENRYFSTHSGGDRVYMK